MNAFFGWITTVSASKATGSSKYSTPAALQSSISFFRIGREASEMSVSSRQNFLKPPPVPEMPTVTLICVLLRLLELLGHRLGDRVHGARAVDLDDLLRESGRRGKDGGRECKGSHIFAPGLHGGSESRRRM